MRAGLAGLTRAELEEEVDLQANQVGMGPRQWEQFKKILGGLRKHHEATYLHSLRVGLYALEVARAEGMGDLKLPFLGGLGHDMGKMEVGEAILGATELSASDWVTIREHPRGGFEVWKEAYLFTGLVAGLHHRLRPDGYGIELREELEALAIGLSETSATKVLAATEVVMLADFFDALTTRNNKQGVALIVDKTDPGQVRGVLEKHFQQWPERVAVLVGTLLMTGPAVRELGNS